MQQCSRRFVAPLAFLLTFACLAAGPTRHEVTIKNSAYAPATISITAGDSVVWTNQDDTDHTVVAADGSFDSGTIKNGQSFEHTFDKAGTIEIACKYHPRMKGKVVVEAK